MTELRRSLLFFYTETPLHAGSGAGLGAIDLPLQRERMSDLPQVQGSGVKGALRELFRAPGEDPMPKTPSPERLREEALFGPRPPDPERSKRKDDTPQETQPNEHAGALAVTDARMLLMPVRTAHGGWAWITSPLLLHRLARDLGSVVGGKPPSWAKKLPVDSDFALVTAANVAITSRSGDLIIEDALYKAKAEPAVAELAEWLKAALPDTEVYAPVRDRLPQQLAVLSDEEMCYWAKHGTEVVTRVRIDHESGTVDEGALWTEEALPSESLLWSLVMMSDSRQSKEAGKRYERSSAEQLEAAFVEMIRRSNRIFLGGDRTVGRGLVALRLWKGGNHGKAA